MIIKYKHLWAWDCMMGSHNYYKDQMQKEAARTNAPINAIFRRSGTPSDWATADTIADDHLRKQINDHAEQIS